MTPRLTLDYGLRWELYTPISERAKRTAGFMTVNGKQEFVVNPQPAYRTDWRGWGPRVQATWQVTGKLSAHAGGGITIIQPNIWQDNMLTGTLPFAVIARGSVGHQCADPLRIPDYAIAVTAGLYPGRCEYLCLGQNQRRCAQHSDGCESLRAGYCRADQRATW